MMIVLLILTMVCAVQAVRASQLLNATICLAAVSALVAIMLYGTGAWQIATIELSVGTGLVTVLMVFAITMVGDEGETIKGQRLPLLLVVVAVLLLVTLTIPFLPVSVIDEQAPLSDVIWEERGFDLMLQVVLIFSGVLGVIGLLATRNTTEESQSDVSLVLSTQAENKQPSLTLEKDVA